MRCSRFHSNTINKYFFSSISDKIRLKMGLVEFKNSSLFKCYSKTVCTTMCALFSSNNPKQHCCRSASCCWSCLECSPRKQRKGSKQLLQRGSLPTVSNRQAVLCRRKPGMVITYKQIRFNSHWTRDNTQYASGFIGSLSRLLPSCLLLKLANHKKLYCLIKHAVEHYQKKPFDHKKKSQSNKSNCHKTIYGWIPFRCFHFRFVWPLSMTLRQKLFCSYKTVTERRLIVEMRYMFLYCHSDADLLCVITVKSVCRKMFEIVLSKLVEKHYPPQKCEKQQ